MSHVCTNARLAALAVLIAASAAGCSASRTANPSTATAAAAAEAAVRFEGLGGYGRPITTSSADAQTWFDQGLVFAWSFNHDEAIRSFYAAAEADPDAAMPWWGIALANGPHINNPLVPETREWLAVAAVQRARELILARSRRPETQSAAQAARAQLEAELVEALATRYASPPTPDRAARDQAYAEAMRRVWTAHPDDADIGALCAEALMDLHPWDLWANDGTPREWTGEILAVLDQVLRLEPEHPGGLHLLIHAVEAGPEPERALAAADRLRHLVPVSGHMLHMPSHIDVLLGRWQEAIDSNLRAIDADARYRAVRPRQEFHHVYMAHNLQMLAFAGMMDGRSALALDAARRIARGVPDDYARRETVAIEPFFSILYDTLVRFGRWDEMLAEPAPPEHLMLTTASWRFARGVSLAAKGQVAEAEAEAARFREAAAKLPPERYVSVNPAQRVLAIAGRVLDGEIAYRRGETDAAVAALHEAVAIEDQLVYMEPPEWALPVRHALGAILLEAGRLDEAEAVYRADLEQWPGNGWSLHGLASCLERKAGKDGAAETGPAAEAAAAARERFRAAWADADVSIGSSCLCVPGR
ncbi:MAG: tetratricopeptide repeat protein [Planctomycetota bacterium]